MALYRQDLPQLSGTMFLTAQYAGLRASHPDLTVLGGCCGTDARHIRAIADACL